MRIVKLTIEYDGTAYVGWQVQPNGPSIQTALESALQQVVGHPVSVVSSGRTDAGVHARGMVAHFEAPGSLPLSAFREGVNRHLPTDIAVVDAAEAPEGFHARFSAKAKRYRYSILTADIRSPLRCRYSWHLRRELNVEVMRQAALALVGEHDFAAFRSSGCDAQTTVREIYGISIRRHGRTIHVDIVGSGFLRNMVRVIVGTLIEIGMAKRPITSIGALLQSGCRDHSGITAPPQGLCLLQVWYDGSPEVWTAGMERCHSCQKSLDK